MTVGDLIALMVLQLVTLGEPHFKQILFFQVPPITAILVYTTKKLLSRILLI